MDRSAKSKTIAERVRSSLRDRTNMRGLHFAPATAVDYFHAREGAGIVIGRFDRSGESGIAKGTGHDALSYWSRKFGRLFVKTIAQRRRRRKDRRLTEDLRKAGAQDGVIFCIWQSSDCAAKGPFVCLTICPPKRRFVVVNAFAKGNGTRKIQIGIDIGVEMVVTLMIRTDVADASRCKVGLPTSAA